MKKTLEEQIKELIENNVKTELNKETEKKLKKELDQQSLKAETQILEVKKALEEQLIIIDGVKDVLKKQISKFGKILKETDPPKITKRERFDIEKLKELVDKGLTMPEIVKEMDKKYPQVRQKLIDLNLYEKVKTAKETIIRKKK